MPILVTHPELGEIEFPDDFSNDQIAAAIRKHENQGFETPMPGDDDVSTGEFAGGNPPAPPVPIPPVGTSGYTPEQQRLFGSPEQQSALRFLQMPEGLRGQQPPPASALLAEALHIDPKEISAAMDSLASASPEIEGEAAQELLTRPVQPPTPGQQIAAGAINAVNKATTSLATPEGAGLMLLGGAPSIASKAVQAAFGAQMLSNLPETAQRAGSTSVTGNLAEKVEAYGDLGLQLFMTKEALSHAAAPGPKINPLNQLKEINAQLASPETVPALADYLKAKAGRLQAKIAVAETALKDAATKADTEVQLSSVDPATGQPWAAGEYAKMDADGKLHVDPDTFHDILKDLSPAKQKTFIDSLVDEEFIHSKIGDADALAYWNSLSPVEQGLVKRRYAGQFGDQFTPEQLGQEALRGRLQQLSSVTPREIAESPSLSIEVRTLLGLEKAVSSARKLFRGTQAQHEIFSKVQENIKAAKEKLGAPAEAPTEQAAATKEPAAAFRKTEPIKKVEEMFAEGGNLKNQTIRSYEIGKSITSKEEIKELLRMQEQKKGEFQEGLKRLLNATPEEQKAIIANGMNASQTINEILEKATGYEPTKMDPGEVAPVPMTKAELEAMRAEVRKEQNASGKQETTEVHGNLQSPAIESAGKVPPAESSGGILPREEPAGTSAEKAPSLLRLSEAAEDPGLAAMKARRAARLAAEGKTAAARRRTAPAEPTEEVTAAKISDLSDAQMGSGKPSFDRFVADAKERFGDLKPGQLREAWEDAVWKKLMAAPGAELEAMVRKLGLLETVGDFAIPDIRKETNPRKLKLTGERAPITVNVTPPRRANVIATIAQKLIGQSMREARALKRKAIKPDEIGWWRPKGNDRPAYFEVTPGQAQSDQLGNILTQGAGIERGGKHSTSGAKATPESVTKRLVGLQDKATGKVELVSVYKTGRGVVYVADPTKTGERIHTPLPDILRKTLTNGEQRFVPKYSVLLDEPVQGFRETFNSDADYQERFGADAAEQLQRQTEAEAEAQTDLTPGMEKPPEKGLLFRNEKTSEDSLRALHDVLTMGEANTMEELQQNLENLFSENRPKDKNGLPKALSLRELKGVDALVFAQDAMMEKAAKEGHPIDPEAALSNILDYLHENKDLTRTEFAAKAYKDFVPVEAQQAPARAAETASPSARELTGPEEPPTLTKKEKLGYVPPAGPGPSANLSGKNPAAFRRDNPLGIVPPVFHDLKDLVGYIKELPENFARFKDQLAGKSAPITSRFDREAGNSLVSYASARLASPLVGRYMATEVLGPHWSDTAFSRKLGALLVEDRLRAIRIKKLQAGDPTAANVRSIIGDPDSPFATEADFQAALADPEIQAAIQRHKDTVQQQAEDAHLEARGDLTEPGLHTQAFVNLKAILPDEESLATGGRGNLQNPLKKKSRFSKQAHGTAEEYELDYRTIAERMVQGNFDEFAKRRMYKALEDAGLAQLKEPGDPRPDIGGKPAVNFQVERRGIPAGQNRAQTFVRNLWVRSDIAPEVRQALDTDGPIAKAGLVNAANWINMIQLKGPTDAVWHVANMLGSIAGSPGGKTLLTDLGRSLPGVNFLDAIAKITASGIKVMRDSPETQKALAELAQIGAMRGEHPAGFLGKAVQFLDRAGRLVRNDMFQNLVDRGILEDRPDLRRQWVNQMGQYNGRLMSQLMRIFKESGFSPFVVAGTTFNRMALRRLALSPGIEAVSKSAAFELRAIQAMGAFATLVAVPSMLNYLITGNPNGRPGTKFGQIDTGKDDKEGKHIVIDPAQWVGLRRGLRITGLQAVIEGNKSGLSSGKIQRNAAHDMLAGIIHPWTGPAPTAAAVAVTGHSPSFYKESENPNDYGENLKAALKQLNPLAEKVFESQDKETSPAGSVAMGLAGAVGVKAAAPVTANSHIQNLAHKFLLGAGGKTALKAQEDELSDFYSVYGPMRNAVRSGNVPKAMKEIEKLRDRRTDAEIQKAMRDYTRRPFTGSRKHEGEFEDSLTPEQKKEYDKARDEKDALYDSFIKLWDKRPDRPE